MLRNWRADPLLGGHLDTEGCLEAWKNPTTITLLSDNDREENSLLNKPEP